MEQFKSAIALDLPLGFYTIPLDDERQKICSTILPWGKYSYLQMPVGIVCSLPMFQLIMTEIYRGLDILVFIGDILEIQRETESTLGGRINIRLFS